MTEREKEYVCDHLCKYPAMFDQLCRYPDMANRSYLDICETCMLNKTRTQLRKEYMQQYYKTKIKPARKRKEGEAE